MSGAIQIATGQHSGKTKGWMTKESGFDVSLSRSIHISSGPRRASSAMGTRDAVVERVVPVV
jgi:hypothetical protein